MESILPFSLAALLALACPLGMGALAVGAWLIARARGEKRGLSMSCMSNHGQHQPQPMHPAEESNLSEKVSALEQEVEVLRARLQASREGVAPAHETVPVSAKEERSA